MSLSKKNPTARLKKIPVGNNYLWWRVTSIIVVGAMFGSALFSIWFIYSNIYTTISNTAAIAVWESTPSTDAVDITAYEQAQKNLLLKSTTTEWPANPRDIFNYADATTTTSATTSTTL
ncbi:MAG: hypothetical protein A3J93_05280 [Candidatus Magasanikbacteria bacterium RIFOXYC2_FULL_42_28]|uniref:Uncharacterized protein n=1 Tax=Candidatus Magasanikbacteria bacterium RIFOXYC2_FULL_42_28 TaxID=1798704 RepID=A0A1F6NVS3_9BACT|nr:MAG: hypothetical protein A3J93_05280 [Candidatus Magasanikbacteria bacterium RIFOXYC2_FULL_42_28]